MNSRISFGISVLVIFSALSGCIVSKGGESASTDATTDGTGDNETSGPTAVLVIRVNGTEVYSSEASADAAGGNATGGNTSASSNGTAAGTTTSATSPAPSGSASANASASASAAPTPSASSSPNASSAAASPTSTGGNTTATDANETSNDTGSGVTIEPNVNVTFDASESEGTNLTFNWTIGNFTSSNETFEYAFNETGTYNVTLTVTDLLNATDERTIEITVASAGPAPGSPMGERMETFRPSGDRIGAPNCAVGGNAESTYQWNILDMDENGTAMKAVKLVVTAEHGSAGVAHRVTLIDPNGEQLGQGTEVSVEGEFAAGEYTVIYRLCGPYSTPASSETFATATYESA